MTFSPQSVTHSLSETENKRNGMELTKSNLHFHEFSKSENHSLFGGGGGILPSYLICFELRRSYPIPIESIDFWCTSCDFSRSGLFRFATMIKTNIAAIQINRNKTMITISIGLSSPSSASVPELFAPSKVVNIETCGLFGEFPGL